MVKITNGINVFVVTKGAFDGIYSHQGYSLCDETDTLIDEVETKEEVLDVEIKDGDNEVVVDNTAEIVEEEKEDSVAADNAFVEEILEKPLSQWSGNEMKEFVRIKDIDTTGAQKVSQVRAIIKKYLDEQAKNA